MRVGDEPRACAAPRAGDEPRVYAPTRRRPRELVERSVHSDRLKPPKILTLCFKLYYSPIQGSVSWELSELRQCPLGVLRRRGSSRCHYRRLGAASGVGRGGRVRQDGRRRLIARFSTTRGDIPCTLRCGRPSDRCGAGTFSRRCASRSQARIGAIRSGFALCTFRCSTITCISSWKRATRGRCRRGCEVWRFVRLVT
jgi:hypothetical protein